MELTEQFDGLLKLHDLNLFRTDRLDKSKQNHELSSLFDVFLCSVMFNITQILDSTFLTYRLKSLLKLQNLKLLVLANFTSNQQILME